MNSRKKENHKSKMEKSMRNELVLSEYEIRATRRNQLEYHRLQRNIDVMHDDLEQRLTRLKRQARYLRHYYTSVVKVVKPNRRYQLWKQAYAYEIERDEKKNWLELIKLRRSSESKTSQSIPSANQVSSESVRPLLLFLGNNIEKPAELISENFLRPKTSPINQHRLNFNKISSNHIQPRLSKPSSASSLRLMMPTDTREFVRNKSNSVQKAAKL